MVSVQFREREREKLLLLLLLLDQMESDPNPVQIMELIVKQDVGRGRSWRIRYRVAWDWMVMMVIIMRRKPGGVCF